MCTTELDRCTGPPTDRPCMRDCAPRCWAARASPPSSARPSLSRPACTCPWPFTPRAAANNRSLTRVGRVAWRSHYTRYHGGELLCPPLRTDLVRTSGNPRWEEWLQFDIETMNLPRVTRRTAEKGRKGETGAEHGRSQMAAERGQTTRLCLTVFARRSAKKTTAAERAGDAQPVGWVNILLMDHRGVLESGTIKRFLWPKERANPIGTRLTRSEDAVEWAA